MAELKKRQPVEILNHWLHLLETEGQGLNDWEEHFVTSLQEQLDDGRGLSERQEDLLESLYARKTA